MSRPKLILIGGALLALLLLLVVASCGERATLPVSAGMGPAPTLPEPAKTLLPTVNVAEAIGWRGSRPVPAAGLEVAAFADRLDHPRWLYVLPNGDVLVAETNAPSNRPKENEGLRAKLERMLMRKAGAGVPSANRITLLRDSDGDGVAETRTIFLSGLNSPFGMALVGDEFYVANSDSILRFPYRTGETHIAAAGVRLTDLPAGERNHHWTKTIVAGPDGARLYASVGSNSNVAEHGMAEEEGRAAIWEIDRATGAKRLFATGLRNAVGLAIEPRTGILWAAVNERDELGSDLVPDYMTSVREGGFYGWPYSYYGNHVDTRVKPARPDLVASALAPDYALGPHTASLGLAFYPGGLLGARYAGGAFVGQHGSWNRKPASGYKVIFVPFAGGRPAGAPADILTGFLDADGQARGRPVGVAVDKAGALLVADDVGNTIWRVTPR
jgi:glucose/arabinose dehydrogenase